MPYRIDGLKDARTEYESADSFDSGHISRLINFFDSHAMGPFHQIRCSHNTIVILRRGEIYSMFDIPCTMDNATYLLA